MAYHRTFRLPVSISRCSNNYGPYHFPEKLIPLSIVNALNDKSLPVYGKGENVRDWLYVEDHCAAIDLIVRKGREGEIYNIGGHNERTNLQVVKAILKELCKPESLIRFVTDRPGHDRRYAIDPAKIERELGWRPATRFEDGIRRTVKWYLENRPWWEHIVTWKRLMDKNPKVRECPILIDTHGLFVLFGLFVGLLIDFWSIRRKAQVNCSRRYFADMLQTGPLDDIISLEKHSRLRFGLPKN